MIVMLMTPSTNTNKNCDNRDSEIEEDVEEEGGEGEEDEEEGEGEGVDQEVAQQEGQPDQEGYGGSTPALVVTGNRVDKLIFATGTQTASEMHVAQRIFSSIFIHFHQLSTILIHIHPTVGTTCVGCKVVFACL